jgi:ribose-phosphate pyrophosphokinase
MIKFYARVPQGWQIISKIEPFRFPAGELSLKVPENLEETPIAALVEGTDVNDYLLLAEWAELVHSQGFKAVAMIPYLPAARADRGHPFGAKVYADLINDAGLDQVICFDPHSSVMPDMIENLTVLYSAPVIKDALFSRDPKHYAGVIAPDHGAIDRTQRVADELGLPMYKAEKHRDFETGKLTGFTCEQLPAEGRFLVVDDICDGGGTFLGLADACGVGRERLGLWVSHGVFSGHAERLLDAFAEIHTTDSLLSANREDIHADIVPLIGHMMAAIKYHN